MQKLKFDKKYISGHANGHDGHDVHFGLDGHNVICIASIDHFDLVVLDLMISADPPIIGLNENQSSLPD